MKPKTGICIDCPPNSGEVPLIAKRCQTHYWQHRREVKGATTKINAKSDKQLTRDIDYAKARKAWIANKIASETKGACEAKIKGVCTIWATQVHHMQGRDGPLLLDTTKWLFVCYGCHQWITEHSKEAIELNLSLLRNT